jgi:hypothetical protein
MQNITLFVPAVITDRGDALLTAGSTSGAPTST